MTNSATPDPRAPVDPEIRRRVAEIMRRPYRTVIAGNPEEGFRAEVPDLPGCVTAGETPEEAAELLRDAMALWLTVAVEQGDRIRTRLHRPSSTAARCWSACPRASIAASPSARRRRASASTSSPWRRLRGGPAKPAREVHAAPCHTS